jgi:thiamine-monophosphate kinase
VRLQELGEFGLIDRIAQRVLPQGRVRIGIGDDAAAIVPGNGMQSLISTDMLVEGVHFDLNYTELGQLGRKALAVNLSDIAAMGGIPRHILLGLAIPKGMQVEKMDAFMDGLFSMASEFDVSLIGGDTCASPSGFVISLTIIGEQLPEKVIPRSGASPGDKLLVTGELGYSALGLHLLQQGERSGKGVMRHLDPMPRVREGVALAETGVVTAMIDVSDGLLADLEHILSNSGVGALVELDAIPLSAKFKEIAGALSLDPYELALTGGEDYELLFTVAPDRLTSAMTALSSCGASSAVIGTIVGGNSLKVVAADGIEYHPKVLGYNHFASHD